MPEEIAEQGHRDRPGERPGGIGREEAQPGHAGRSCRQGADNAQPGDEAGEENRPDAVTVEIALRQLQRLGGQEEEPSTVLQPRAGPFAA